MKDHGVQKCKRKPVIVFSPVVPSRNRWFLTLAFQQTVSIVKQLLASAAMLCDIRH